MTHPASLGIDAEPLARHDCPGPRYTSFPTAVEFDDLVGSEQYLGWLSQLVL